MEKFKVGQVVWYCDVKFHGSGRTKLNIPPCQVKIKEVSENYIMIDGSGMKKKPLFTKYYIDGVDGGLISYYKAYISRHISDTKEECIKKYNNLLLESIDSLKESYLSIEKKILSMVL